MGIEYTIEATERGLTDWYRMDAAGQAGNDFFLVVDMNEAGAGRVDVEFAVQKTLDANTSSIQHNILKDITSSTASTLHVPVTAFRLNVLEYTAGTITLRIIQSEP
jgi:hypothetical protein